jgi:hypothetical protein
MLQTTVSSFGLHIQETEAAACNASYNISDITNVNEHIDETVQNSDISSTNMELSFYGKNSRFRTW